MAIGFGIASRNWWRAQIKGGVSPFLLDVYSGAEAAYSLRALSKNSTNVIRVRRDSDNAEQDFTPSQITDGTLAAFVGSGNNGYVTTWYDQSGNGNDATQSTAASQPQIVSGGVVNIENGKPIIQLTSASSITLVTPISLTNKTLDTFTVSTANPTSTLYGSSTTQFYLLASSGSGSYTGPSVTSEFYRVNGVSKVFADRADIGATLTPQNILTAKFTNNSAVSNNLQLGYGPASFGGYDMQEWIIYETDQTSNYAGIETNINNFYSIY